MHIYIKQKRTLKKARITSWNRLINDINHTKNTKRAWNFAKSLINSPQSNLNAWYHMNRNTCPTQDRTKALANEFVGLFTPYSTLPNRTNDHTSSAFTDVIEDALHDFRNPLNAPFTLNKLTRSITLCSGS